MALGITIGIVIGVMLVVTHFAVFLFGVAVGKS